MKQRRKGGRSEGDRKSQRGEISDIKVVISVIVFLILH